MLKVSYINPTDLLFGAEHFDPALPLCAFLDLLCTTRAMPAGFCSASAPDACIDVDDSVSIEYDELASVNTEYEVFALLQSTLDLLEVNVPLASSLTVGNISFAS